MRVQKRQRQYQQSQPKPEAAFTLIAEPPQQIQGGQQHAPAKEGGALRDQQICDGVDPDDVLLDKIGRCCVKTGEDARKIRGGAEKIHKPEPTAHKKQIERKACFGSAARHAAGQLPEHAVHREKGGQHRQQVSGAQIRPQQKKDTGDRFAEERVAKPVCAAQQGIARRKITALRNIADEPQMHRHIAIAALPGVEGTVHCVQHMGVQQKQRHGGHRQQAGPACPAVGVFCGSMQPGAAPQQHPAQPCRSGTRQPGGWQGKSERQGKQGGQRRQQGYPKPAAQRKKNGTVCVRHGPARQQQTDKEKQEQIANGYNHDAPYTPSRSNGGVYSSRALLFSCM